MKNRAFALLLLCPLLVACETREGGFAITSTSTASTGLTGLTLSAGTLTPAFTPATTSYSAGVGNTVSTITVTPRAAANAEVTVNGATVASGTASPPIPLVVGGNIINVSVETTAGTRIYVVNVARAAP